MRSGDYSRQLWYLHRCGLHCYLARSRLFKRCSFFWGLYWPLTPRDDLTLVLTHFFSRCTRWKPALRPSSKALTPTTPISWWARCLNLLSPLGVGPRLLWFPRSNNYQHQPQASGLNDSYISTWSYQERWKRRARCLSSCKTHQKFNKKQFSSCFLFFLAPRSVTRGIIIIANEIYSLQRPSPPYFIWIAFITGNSSLEPLIEGLCAQIHVNLKWRVFGRNRTGGLTDYWLSWVPRSPPLSYGDRWITENPLGPSFFKVHQVNIQVNIQARSGVQRIENQV